MQDATSAGLSARAGLHSGEIGHVDGGVRGLAVELARQVAASARPGEVLVSSTVKDILAGSGLSFEERGRMDGSRAYVLAQ